MGRLYMEGAKQEEEIGGSRRNASRASPTSFFRRIRHSSDADVSVRPSATFLPFGVNDGVSSSLNPSNGKRGFVDRRVL